MYDPLPKLIKENKVKVVNERLFFYYFCFLASMTCLGSLICGLILGWMDHRAERILGRQQEQAKDEPFHILDVLHFKPVFWLVSVICVAYYLAIFPFIALGK